MIPSRSAFRVALALPGVTGLLAGLQGLAFPAYAQVDPPAALEAPHGVWVDGSLGIHSTASPVSYDDTTSTFAIGPELGEFSSNRGTLFHSFLYFGLLEGEIADFRTEAATDQILARVTGGDPSTIKGTIRSPTDLFLMNPAGITFVTGGEMDIRGSFHATTADYLAFGQGGERFSASPLLPLPLMVTAPPSHFGFTSQAPESVELWAVDSQPYRFEAGGVVSLIGGSVEVTNKATDESAAAAYAIKAPGATLQLAGAAAPMEIPVDLASVNAEALPPEMGIVTLHGVLVNVTGDGSEQVGLPAAGRIVIRGEHFSLEGRSVLGANHNATTGAEGGIDIAAAGTVSLSDASLIESLVSLDSGEGPDIAIKARTIEVVDQASVRVETLADGAAGDIRLEGTESIEISSDGAVRSWAQYRARGASGTGSGGDITLTSPMVFVEDGGKVRSFASAAGDGGDIEIRADSLSLRGGGSVGTFTGLKRNGVVVAGAVGDGGDVTIEANHVSVDGSSTSLETAISTLTYGKGEGGDLSVRDSVGEAWGGGLTEVDLRDGGQMIAATEGEGNAGNLEIRDAAIVRLAGDNGLDGDSLRPSGLTSRARADATGSGGRIDVEAEALEVLDGAQIAVSTLGRGPAGSIDLRATQRISLRSAPGTKPSLISAGSVGNDDPDFDLAKVGDAGTIRLETDQLEVLDGGQVTTSKNGTVAPSDLPTAGSLTVIAQDVLISGNESGIYTEAASPFGADARSGGNLKIVATGDVVLSDGAFVSADSTEGGGDAGTIEIHAGSSLLIAGSKLFTYARGASGGDIVIEAAETVEIVGASVYTKVDSGNLDAGAITLRGDHTPGSAIGAVALIDSEVFTTAVEGAGGDISITARGYLASGDSTVDAHSARSIDGKIIVRAPANDLTTEVAALPVGLLDRAALVASACGPEGFQEASFQVQRRGVPPLPPDLSAAWSRPAAAPPCVREESLQ